MSYRIFTKMHYYERKLHCNYHSHTIYITYTAYTRSVFTIYVNNKCYIYYVRVYPAAVPWLTCQKEDKGLTLCSLCEICGG